MNGQLIISIAILACILSGSMAFNPKGQAKAQQLRDLANKNPFGIIRLNATSYRRFVMESPRPYDFVIFFTANSCQYCDEMMVQYQQVAQFYQESGALFPERDEKKQQRSVFFGIVYFTQDFREIFLELDFKSVPNVLVATPKISVISNEERQNFVKDFQWQISQTDGVVTSYKILQYINKKTGRDIEHQVPLSSVLLTLSVIGGTLGLIFILLFKFQPFFLNPQLWFVGSITIYAICGAGVIYNLLHGVPFTTTDRQGNTQFFSSQNRSQLGAEGYIMSVAICMVGILIISWTKIYKNNWNSMIKRFVLLALFSFTYLVVLFIEDVYRKKGWYSPNFYPPAHYIKGPLMRDQGNSI